MRALDRYTLQFRLAKPRPRFLYILADSSLVGAVAREVVELYGDRRSPSTRSAPGRSGSARGGAARTSCSSATRLTARCATTPSRPPTTPKAQALLRALQGQAPADDRPASRSRSSRRASRAGSSFLNGEFDLVARAARVRRPGRARRQARAATSPSAASRWHRYREPGPHAVLLQHGGPDGRRLHARARSRCAARSAWRPTSQREIASSAAARRSPRSRSSPPGSCGYDPDYRSENSEYDVARAKALLDMYGYVDRDGDGWREHARRPAARHRIRDHARRAVAPVRRAVEEEPRCDRRAAAHQGRAVARAAEGRARRPADGLAARLHAPRRPTCRTALQLLYGPAAGGQNLPRFKDARFDEIYRRMQRLPDGPERARAAARGAADLTAYVPQKYNVHRIVTYLMQPWLPATARRSTATSSGNTSTSTATGARALLYEREMTTC